MTHRTHVSTDTGSTILWRNLRSQECWCTPLWQSAAWPQDVCLDMRIDLIHRDTCPEMGTDICTELCIAEKNMPTETRKDPRRYEWTERGVRREMYAVDHAIKTNNAPIDQQW